MLNQQASLKHNWYSAPGKSILDLIEQRNIPKSTLPDILNISHTTLEDLLNGYKAIDNSIATKLSKEIGGSVQFWIKREEQFREDLLRLENISADKLLSDFDVNYVSKNSLSNDSVTQKDKFLNFFDVPDFPSWKLKYSDLFKRVYFKKSHTLQSKKVGLATWLRCAEIYSNTIKTSSWDKDKLIASLDDIRHLTKEKDPNIFIPHLKDIFASCGVKFLILKTPKGCPISGAIRFIDENPVLVLSLRYKSDDHFWFTIFHEIGHLIQHNIQDIFLEDRTDQGDVDKIEGEANYFAEKTLLSGLDKDALKRISISHRNIVRKAVELNISPGILVGQLQFYEIVSHKHFNNLKRRYTWDNNITQ